MAHMAPGFSTLLEASTFQAHPVCPVVLAVPVPVEGAMKKTVAREPKHMVLKVNVVAQSANPWPTVPASHMCPVCVQAALLPIRLCARGCRWPLGTRVGEAPGFPGWDQDNTVDETSF